MAVILLALLSTFSIVGYDRDSGEWGIAVASKVPFVGQMVPWAEAGAGAVATQAWANLGYGPAGLRLLAEGMAAEDVIAALVGSDSLYDQRQIGVVDSRGNSASFTGAGTMAWSGGVTGPGYAIQGNILTGPEVVSEMERAFLESEGEILAFRLLEALKAGEDAGGDSRGRQSAAILVVRENGGHDGNTDILVDIQVSDNPEAVTELQTALLPLVGAPQHARDVHRGTGRSRSFQNGDPGLRRGLDEEFRCMVDGGGRSGA